MAAKAHKELNLGKILQDGGLISPAQLNRALQEQSKTGSSLLEILTKKRYISMQRLVDLLTHDIPLPFGSKDPDKVLKGLLLDSGLTTEDELQKLVDESELGKILVDHKYIQPFQLQLARQEQEKTGLPLWRTLINQKFVSPNDMTQVLKDHMYRAKHTDLDELIGEILVNTKQITPEQLAEAQKQKRASRKPLGQILTETQMVSADSLAKALGDHLNIQFIDLQQAEIEPAVAAMLPENFIREFRVLPIKREEPSESQTPRLFVAVIDPLDVAIRDNLRMMSGCEIVPLLTTEKALIETIDRVFPALPASGPPEPTEPAANVVQVSSEAEVLHQVFPSEIADGREDVSTVKLVNSLIEGAVHANATDIHLEPQAREELRVRYRIDGMLHDIMTIPQHLHPNVISRIKVLADMDITDRRQSQDGHITMRVGDTEYYMRIGTLPTKLGERLVVRLLNERQIIIGLKQLGLEPEDLNLVEEFIETPYGMILVTGPVGSGKTTTLYSALNEINILTKNIITIEDPVEYQLPGISQVEVDPKIGLTFATGLRSILRQDPNTLMVGEIRDPETASVAARAALTGQQLFSTLHTQDASGAITTLSYLGVQPFWIASALVGVIAQRLVRKVCPYCKEPYQPEPRFLQLLNLESGDDTHAQFYHGRGCDKCFHTGYSGRIGVFEVMKLDEQIRELITSGASEAVLKKTAIEHGMNTLRVSSIKKILRGETTIEEALRVIL
jgi:type IV pilus assembly protein PilB